MINETKLREAITRGAEQWRMRNKELLSCFDAEKLFERIHAHNDLQPDEDFGVLLKTRIIYGEPGRRNAMVAAISELGPNQEELVERGIELSFDKAFITLWDRGALHPLLVVDEVPARAQQNLDVMAARVEAARPAPKAQAVMPSPPADPVDVCVKDFHEMGSKAFQAKYLSNTNNRRFYEAAIDRGLI
jgi:hypothetical protein